MRTCRGQGWAGPTPLQRTKASRLRQQVRAVTSAAVGHPPSSHRGHPLHSTAQLGQRSKDGTLWSCPSPVVARSATTATVTFEYRAKPHRRNEDEGKGNGGGGGRVRTLARPNGGGLELVVPLVDVDVQKRVVQRTVHPIEHRIASEHHPEKVPHRLAKPVERKWEKRERERRRER